MKVAAALLIALAAAAAAQAGTAGHDTASSQPENRAVYITMPDGTRIAAEIWLPRAPKDGEKFATLVSFTRYWRARELDPPSTDIDEPVKTMLNAGYAVVVADARGSGASFGIRGAEFSPCETRDFRSVIDWIAAQPWSTGRVATVGISYTGNTAEHATYDPSPALVAAVPRFTDFDAYASILFPGGLRNALITDQWATAVHALDNNSVPSGNWRSHGPKGEQLVGVKPVDADRDDSDLRGAIAEHAKNQDFYAVLSAAEFREDLHMTGDLTGTCDQVVTPYLLLGRKPKRSVPAYHWASWMDAGTAAGVLARFTSDPRGYYIIGPWTHAAEFDAEVFNSEDVPVMPSVADQYAQVFNFLAPRMGRPASGNPPPSGLTYYTMGEKAWKHTARWPPAGSISMTWFLSESRELRTDTTAAQDGVDKYTVDFEAGSGSKTRWSTQLGGSDVYYGDRREMDARLLTYTSAPLERDTEITGTPAVQLFVESTHADGALIVYLELVDPSGRVTMITEGELRLIHRRVATGTPPYAMFGPYHSFERKDAVPMVAGKVEKIEIGMLPTSVRVPAGYALRLAIAGHDKDSFYRYPAEGTPTFRVHRGKGYPSGMTLPGLIGNLKRAK